VYIRREQRNTQEKRMKKKGWERRANKEHRCMMHTDACFLCLMFSHTSSFLGTYAPKNEDVCENIKHKKHEYREEIYAELRGRSAIEDVRAVEML
jgi:hypothetical protein